MMIKIISAPPHPAGRLEHRGRTPEQEHLTWPLLCPEGLSRPTQPSGDSSSTFPSHRSVHTEEIEATRQVSDVFYWDVLLLYKSEQNRCSFIIVTCLTWRKRSLHRPFKRSSCCFRSSDTVSSHVSIRKFPASFMAAWWSIQQLRFLKNS